MTKILSTAELLARLGSRGYQPGRDELEPLLRLLETDERDAAEAASRALARLGGVAAAAAMARFAGAAPLGRARLCRLVGRVAATTGGEATSGRDAMPATRMPASGRESVPASDLAAASGAASSTNRGEMSSTGASSTPGGEASSGGEVSSGVASSTNRGEASSGVASSTNGGKASSGVASSTNRGKASSGGDAATSAGEAAAASTGVASSTGGAPVTSGGQPAETGGAPASRATPREMLRFLLARLDDSDEKTARNAALALGKQRAGEVESALINRLRRGAAPLLMRALVEALGKVGGQEARVLLDGLASCWQAPTHAASRGREGDVAAGASAAEAEPGAARAPTIGKRHDPGERRFPDGGQAHEPGSAERDSADELDTSEGGGAADRRDVRGGRADERVGAEGGRADEPDGGKDRIGDERSDPEGSVADESRAAEVGGAGDAELARLLDEARLKLSRTLDRAQGGRIRAAVTPRAPLAVVAHCRHGLARLLAEELADFAPRVLDDETVALTLRAPLASLFRARTMLRFGFPLPVPRGAEPGDAVVAALTSDAAWAIFSQLSDGPMRYRIEWAQAGHRRGLTFRCAAAIAHARPALINDPTASPWEAIVREGEPARETTRNSASDERGERAERDARKAKAGGDKRKATADERKARAAFDARSAHAASNPAGEQAVTVELWPRGLPDPRFAYRRAHVPASSHPTLAAALARLAGARPDDVVWDPFTGAGTELVERARLGPFRQLLGTDVDGRALALARQNLEAAAVTATLTVADARSFVPPEPPTLILTNPPMGRRVLDRHATGALYRDFLAHAAQLLPPGGRLVWISPRGDETLAIAEPLGLRCTVRQRVDMAGFWGELQAFTRGSRAAARFSTARPPSLKKPAGPPRSRKPRR